MRKFDDWHTHKHEKNRDLNAEYRETELHGVVGKEIHDLLKNEKSSDQSNIQGQDIKGQQFSNQQQFNQGSQGNR